MSGKVSQDLKNLPIGTFNKTTRGRVVSHNECLSYSIMKTNISEVLLELRAIVSEENLRSLVRANQLRDKGMTNRHCGLVKWSKKERHSD